MRLRSLLKEAAAKNTKAATSMPNAMGELSIKRGEPSSSMAARRKFTSAI